MARITTHRGSSKDTHNYYLADYYDAGPEFTGQWLGRGAERLGLEGEVDSKEFMLLLNNQHPKTGEKLSERNRDNRRSGWDICFSAPKSVSILFGINNDREIINALRDATNETLLEMEQDVMRRVNLPDGKQRHEKTRNLIAGVWIHPDARAVDGYVPDMQIHSHAFVSNHTFVDSKNRFLAADISNLFRDAQGYYESAFQSRLASNLQNLGYEVQRSRNNFEIRGISRELIDKFSKRTGQINERIDEGYANRLAAKNGISLKDAKGMIGGISRDRKSQSYTLDELQKKWHEQLSPLETKQLDLVEQNKGISTTTNSKLITPKLAVDYALEHGFEREAVLRERNILRDAIKYGIAENNVEEIKQELAQRDLIRQGKEESAVATTKALQEEELAILNFAKGGRGEVKPINAHYAPEASQLSDEQQLAVTGLLASSDRLQIVHGVAGVGKSYMLQQLVPEIQSKHKAVAIMAPTNKATDNLREDGFEATTVKSFLLNNEAQSEIRNGVIIVDEAGLIGSPTFKSIVQIAKEQNTRIIAVGDTKQHLPIERGHPVMMLLKEASILPKEITKIRRQEGNYRQAVEALSRGEIAQGFQELERLEFVHELEDENRNAKLANDFADAREKHPNDKLLVIAPTHAERREVIEAIREELKSRKLIQSTDLKLTTYTTKQLSKAERQDPLNFEPGDLVAFHAKGQGGIQAGEQLKVTRVTKSKVYAEGNREVPLESAGGFALFRPESAKYAVGDTIRLTRGRRQEIGQKKLINGSLHTIQSIKEGVIQLENGEILDKDWKFFDQGLAVTSHVSQGTTVDRAFVAASSLSFPASSSEQMYVSASRAKKQVAIYTDSINGLKQAIEKSRPKQLATSVIPEESSIEKSVRFFETWNRIKSVTQRFVTKKLGRFHDWLPSHGPEPHLSR